MITPPVIIPTTVNYLLASAGTKDVYALDTDNSMLYSLVDTKLQKISVVDTQDQEILLFTVMEDQPVLVTTTRIVFPLQKQIHEAHITKACLFNG